MTEKRKALIAMSGGVDSSVAAALMQEEGYDCVGAMMKLYRNEDSGQEEERQESGAEIYHAVDAVKDAAAVAGKLGIPFHVFRLTEGFRCHVMDRFVNSYLAGETPNPCIECNKYMKFGELMRQAGMLGCDKVATGHYVRISQDAKSGRWQMRTARDKSKDQSYVLYTLTQEQLAHVCFPLGELTKMQVRELAEKYGFYNAHKKESQDICFVPDGHYDKFIERYIGKKLPEGNFVTEEGEVLGLHRGIIHYTVGQRKGLGIAAAHPLYVKEIRPETNEVVLCAQEELFRSTLYAGEVNWLSIPEPAGEICVQAKIRYRHTAQPGKARMLENGMLQVIFEKPQRAVTKGQSVVLYDGELVLGGGIIRGSA